MKEMTVEERFAFAVAREKMRGKDSLSHTAPNVQLSYCFKVRFVCGMFVTIADPVLLGCVAARRGERLYFTFAIHSYDYIIPVRTSFLMFGCVCLGTIYAGGFEFSNLFR